MAATWLFPASKLGIKTPDTLFAITPGTGFIKPLHLAFFPIIPSHFWLFALALIGK
jgi:hypothetical protein